MKNRFKGISWSSARGLYLVRLTLNGKQRFIAEVPDDESQAAYLYDVALWRLLAWTTPVAVPNFPERFPHINVIEANKLCPKLQEIYLELTEEDSRFNRDTNQMRLVREKQIESKIRDSLELSIQKFLRPLVPYFQTFSLFESSLLDLVGKSSELAAVLPKLMVKTPRTRSDLESFCKSCSDLLSQFKSVQENLNSDRDYLKKFYFDSLNGNNS